MFVLSVLRDFLLEYFVELKVENGGQSRLQISRHQALEETLVSFILQDFCKTVSHPRILMGLSHAHSTEFESLNLQSFSDRVQWVG